MGPTKHESLAEFAKRIYRLPPGSPIEGYFDINYTPHLIKILECCSFDSLYQFVNFKKNTQSAGTTALIINLLYSAYKLLSVKQMQAFPTHDL